MVICGYTPEPDADTSTQVSVTIDSHVAQTLSVNDGSSEIEVNVAAEGTPIHIDVESRVSPEKGNVGDGDKRDLAFVLINVKVDPIRLLQDRAGSLRAPISSLLRRVTAKGLVR